MNKNKILPLAIAAALGSLSSTSVMAAGFQLAEYSATGLGRAYAGEAAMADNAAAQFRNPAMLTYLEGTQVSTGLIYVDPNVDVDGTTTQTNPFTQQSTSTATSSKDFADAAFIPNFYASHQVNDQVFLGLALSSNFGMHTKLDDGFKGTQFGNEASVMTMEINPNIAYRINDQFSIGGGVRYVMGEGSIGAKSSADVLGGLIPSGTTLKYMEGDDTSWGWQAGAAWQINPDNRVGFNYRSEVDLRLEGHATGFAFGTVTKQLAGSMGLTLPATAELASFHQLTNKVAVHASVNWTDWSTFEKLEANIPSLSEPTQIVKQENWKDNYRFAVGATYELNDKTQLRSGVAYDTSAVDDANRTITIPETDRLWLSLGAGYAWSKDLTLDAGFTYIFAKEADVVEPRPGIESDAAGALFGGTFKGQTTGSVWLAGVQATYRF